MDVSWVLEHDQGPSITCNICDCLVCGESGRSFGVRMKVLEHLKWNPEFNLHSLSVLITSHSYDIGLRWDQNLRVANSKSYPTVGITCQSEAWRSQNCHLKSEKILWKARRDAPSQAWRLGGSPAARNAIFRDFLYIFSFLSEKHILDHSFTPRNPRACSLGPFDCIHHCSLNLII